MPSIEQRLQRLEDEAAIKELAARFADAATRNDIETIKTLFTEDAVFSIKGNGAKLREGKSAVSPIG